MNVKIKTLIKLSLLLILIFLYFAAQFQISISNSPRIVQNVINRIDDCVPNVYKTNFTSASKLKTLVKFDMNKKFELILF